MCLSRLSLLSVPYIICLCHLDLADSRLLMIPSDRHLNHNELVTNDAIKKVMLPTTISNTSICIFDFHKLANSTFIFVESTL